MAAEGRDPAGDAQFAAFMVEQRQGKLARELDDKLAELVQAVEQHAKKGTLALKITVTPGKAEGTFEIQDDVDLKAPKPPRRPSLFFSAGHGQLSRRDPRQQELADTGSPRTASADDDDDRPLRAVDNPRNNEEAV